MRFKKKGWIFAQTPIWAACDPHISDGAHRLLGYLDWRQGPDDCCWPSLRRMAGDLGASRSTIRRRLRELERAGYLITRRRRGSSSKYFLVPNPDGASDKYTPLTGRPEGGTAWTLASRAPSELPDRPASADGGDRSDATRSPCSGGGVPPSQAPGTPVMSDAHDDRKEREPADEEKDDEQLAGWPSVLSNLRLQMTHRVFETWLSTATARREGERLVIQLVSEEALDWVSQRLHGTICRTVRRVLEEEHLPVVYEVRDKL